MQIENYTVYSTADILALIHMLNQVCATGCGWQENTKFVVAYWQGRRQSPEMNVKPSCLLDRERGALTLKIKKPERLSLAPVELLSLAGERPCLPDLVACELCDALLCHQWSALISTVRLRALLSTNKIRIMEHPDLVEAKDALKQRVAEKKVRKAMEKALYLGLRMGPSREQVQAKVDALEAVRVHLSAPQVRLLEALRCQVDAMVNVAAASVTLSATLNERP